MIKKIIKKQFLKQDGQVAVLTGLLIAVFIAVIAFVVDEGIIYHSRSTFQTVADSAALAGAQELPDTSAAIQAAIDYAEMHDVPSENLVITLEETFVPNDTIHITAAEADEKMYFAGIFGINSTTVGADSTALIGSPAIYGNIVPFGILESDWIPGEEYELKWGPPGNQGNFGALALGGNGANNYRKNIREGYQEPLSVGDIIETEPGNMKGPTLQGTEDRIYDYYNYSFDSFEELVEYKDGGYVLKDASDSQFVICPLIDEVPHGRGEVTILGFIPFIITDINCSEVFGTFINEALIVTEGEIAPLDEHGIRIIRLKE